VRTSLPPPAKKTPVFLVTHEFYPRHGGIATFAEQIARAAADLGYDIEVWPRPRSQLRRRKAWPFRLRRLPLKGTHGIGCQIRMMREMIIHRRRLRYATVYLPEPGPMMAMIDAPGGAVLSPQSSRVDLSRVGNP